MNNPIDSTSLFDSRDLIEYKEYLESVILDAYIEWVESHNEHKDEETEELDIPDSFEEIEFLDEESFTQGCDEVEELENINDFISELEDYGDFEYGEAIISEDYFTEYCEDLVKELGYLSDDLPAFIENNIDWDAVAEDLKVDYTTVTYEGTEYFIRA